MENDERAGAPGIMKVAKDSRHGSEGAARAEAASPEDVELQGQRFGVSPFDLEATLTSGQAFRWVATRAGWESIVGGRWVRLVPCDGGIEAQGIVGAVDWDGWRRYLRLSDPWETMVGTFPSDAPMKRAMEACPGLRLLSQDPWECLASFICSSTKQIVQIQEIIRLLCSRYGERVAAPATFPTPYSFPSAERLASLTEAALRGCKLGFRAPYLLGTARRVVEEGWDFGAMRRMELEVARERLISLPGVGRKIADCVLLFSLDQLRAFPVDVWVQRALRELYFAKARRVTSRRLVAFSERHFGAYGGYAQQYLFHYYRVKVGRPNKKPPERKSPCESGGGDRTSLSGPKNSAD